MRFIETGPDIPDDLLVDRDEGNVVFFCGAGVSLAKAYLPDFMKLAGKVINDLGSLTGSQARRLYDAACTPLPSGAKSYVPVDRMFSSLDMEFDPREVRDAVALALKPKPNVDLEAHRTLIDLSRGSDGRPRLITTNFDLLFEACDAQLKSSGPPNLPVPDRPADFEGIIHLHGRTNEDYTGISDDSIVLSSSDFGKAYLSDGWATHYIRRLMNRFKIVFVGYSADDPPVQYLLEALREEQAPITNIYAFQYGDEVDARELWLQKGVVPIAYGKSYDQLWDTLKAWAERARDTDGWHQKSIIEAAVGPSKVTPIFRGQIAHLASTSIGMAKLSSLKPALPSTWLYVFDPTIRYLTPQPAERYTPDSDTFDPFEHLGLDSDEPPPPVDPDDFDERKVPAGAWSAFEINKSDLVGLTEKEVGSFHSQSVMVNRMWKLAVLLFQRMHETPTLWWAVGQSSIHPQVAHQIEHQLRYRGQDVGDTLAKYWRYLLNAWKEPSREIDQVAIELNSRARAYGWSPSLVREAIDLSRPRIAISRKFGVAPPMTADADPTSFIGLDVEYPRPYQQFAFDAAQLPLAVFLWRSLLIEAEQMESEIDGYISLDTTRPDDGKRLDSDTYGLMGPLIAFTHLTEALAAADLPAAAKEVRSWLDLPGVVFERLRIWAAGHADLTTSEYAESVFSSLSDGTFWSYKHECDLLFAIRDRWDDLSTDGKLFIEARLLTSPIPQLKDLDRKAAQERDAVYRLNAIHWLTSRGVVFSFDVATEKARLVELAPIWHDEFSETVAQPRIFGPYAVTTDTDASSLMDVPPDELLPIAVPERSFRDTVEHDPFAGYSATNPKQAVQALQSAMRRNVETVWDYWSTFLRSTSELETNAELDSEVIVLIVSIPPEQVVKFWYPMVEWASHRARKLEERGLGEFDLVWDKVITAAENHPSSYKQKPGRDWSFEALNSIIGRLVMALLDINLPSEQKGVPAVWIDRLNKALGLPGDHARHALHHVARRSTWFHHYEPIWWDARILPMAQDKSAYGDAFWSGFARMSHAPDPDLFQKLKFAMLDRVVICGREERNLVANLLVGWVAKPKQLISDTELRDVLILSGDEIRRSVLWFIGNWAVETQEWKDLVIPFLTDIWPKQRTVKTPQMSSALFRFASRLPEQFAAIIDLIAGRLVPLTRGHDIHLHCEVSDLDEVGIEALLTALNLLLPENRSEWPYEGKRIIDAMVTAGLGEGAMRDELEKRAAEREY